MLIIFAGVVFTYATAVTYYFWKLTRPDTILSLPPEWNATVSGCYYINLDTCPERETYMDKMFTQHRIPCERVQATDGEDATESYPDVMISEKDVGIKLSHIKVLGMAKARGWTVVFEDDIDILDNRILKYLDSLPAISHMAHFGINPWTVLWGLLTFRFTRVSNGVWSTTYPTRCSHAYAVTRKGAEAWLNKIESNFYEYPLNEHENGISVVHVCHKITDMWHLWKVLTLKNMSYATQDKKKFGYL